MQLISWIWSLVVPIPPLLGISNYEYNADRGFCRINWLAVSVLDDFQFINIFLTINESLHKIIDLEQFLRYKNPKKLVSFFQREPRAQFYSLISVSVFVIVPLCLITVLNFILLLTSWKLRLTTPALVYQNRSRYSACCLDLNCNCNTVMFCVSHLDSCVVVSGTDKHKTVHCRVMWSL